MSKLQKTIVGQQTESLRRPFLPAQEQAVKDAADKIQGAFNKLLEENLKSETPGIPAQVRLSVDWNETKEPVVSIRVAYIREAEMKADKKD